MLALTGHHGVHEHLRFRACALPLLGRWCSHALRQVAMYGSDFCSAGKQVTSPLQQPYHKLSHLIEKKSPSRELDVLIGFGGTLQTWDLICASGFDMIINQARYSDTHKISAYDSWRFNASLVQDLTSMALTVGAFGGAIIGGEWHL